MFYFDHSATTPLHPQVFSWMSEIEANHFGNPSSVHALGQKAKVLIEKARSQMAAALGCSSNEIVFTGGGTEANNLVLWNLIHQDKKHVITSQIEHPAVLNILDYLSEFGVSYTAVSVDKTGMVNSAEIESAIQSETGLITIMLANNEMGTIQPIKQISRIAHKHKIIFHSDAIQTPGKIPVDVYESDVDLMSFSAHKFYGPKGVGALFIKNGVKIKPLILGASQERKLRAGTENTVGIAGCGLAAELAYKNLPKTSEHLLALQEYFLNKLKTMDSKFIINGHPKQSIPGLVSVTFPGVRSDLLMIHLDREKIAVSSGSACSSGDIQPSRVLKAMGIPDNLNICTIRISFGTGNQLSDVDVLVEKLKLSLNRIKTSK